MKKSKRILKKIIVILMILFSIMSCNPISSTQASQSIITGMQQNNQNSNGTSLTNTNNNQSSTNGPGPVETFIDGVAGFILLPTKLGLLLLGEAMALIMGAFSGKGFFTELTLPDILFNKLEITGIDFFDFSSKEDVVIKIRENVAIWYVSIRNLAAILLVVVAFYVAIRMAISTTSSDDRARYKTMFLDWVTSICILFILQYAMIITIRLNNALVETIGSSVKNNSLSEITAEFRNTALLDIRFSKGIADAVMFVMLEGMTLVFLITYIKRMITIGFLIVISPLVTVTYSIDRMGDGKSQALNTWFKEFVYNILIQPFQCVTYLALASSALDEMQTADLKNALIAILMIMFIISSEEIIKKIFNFQSDSMAKTVASAAITTSILNAVSKRKENKYAGGGGSGGGAPEAKSPIVDRLAKIPSVAGAVKRIPKPALVALEAGYRANKAATGALRSFALTAGMTGNEEAAITSTITGYSNGNKEGKAKVKRWKRVFGI